MTTSSTDVLVVGAGPTELTLACELLRHGITCRLIDVLDAPVVYSKAAAVNARTLEVFDGGYVGYRAQPASIDKLEAYLRTIVRSPR